MRLILLFAVVFILLGCKDEQPQTSCDIANCFNGNCVDDLCQCDVGYEGEDCLYQSRPNFILVKGVELKEWPELQFGNEWESDGTGPDIVFTRGLTGSIGWSTEEIKDALEDSTYFFDFIEEDTLYHYHYYRFRLYEVDSPNVHLMETVNKRVYNDQNQFPNPIRIEEGEMIVDLHVEYIF